MASTDTPRCAVGLGRPLCRWSCRRRPVTWLAVAGIALLQALRQRSHGVHIEAVFVACARQKALCRDSRKLQGAAKICTGAQGSRSDSSSGQAPGSPSPFGAPGQPPLGGAGEEDPMKLFQQLLSGQVDPQGMPGAMPGAGAAGMENPLAAMLAGAGGQQKKKTTDGWFTDRIPLLQKIKRPALIAFFGYCFYRGWVGKWGLLMGSMAGSYFDALAVPLRVLPGSPGYGRAYIVVQLYVDYFFKLVGYIINVGKGKAKFPPDFSSMFKPPGGAGANPFAAGGNPFGAAGGAPGGNPFADEKALANLFGDTAGANPFADMTSEPKPTTVETMAGLQGMPTAPTVGSPPPQMPSTPISTPVAASSSPPASKPPPPRNPPPVIDADVTFLD